MKVSKLLLILLIVGLVVLAGCSNKSKYSTPPSGPSGTVVGGGCGVAGVPVNVETVNEIISVETADAV